MYFKPLPNVNRPTTEAAEAGTSPLVPRRQLQYQAASGSRQQNGTASEFQQVLAGQLSAQSYTQSYPSQYPYAYNPATMGGYYASYAAYSPYQAAYQPLNYGYQMYYPGYQMPYSGLSSAYTGTSKVSEDPEIVYAEPPDVPEGISQQEDKIYFKGDFVAVLDITQGGQLDELYYGGEQLLFGNGLWMHSSPEGAADGTGLGYEMAFEEEPQVTVEGNKVTIEGRLYRSNGSDEYAGHRYRRTYTFDSPDSFKVDHQMWISEDDQDQARSEFGDVPDQFYVWAVPLDANLPNYAWNANQYWQGVSNHWQGVSWDSNSQGRIPDVPQGRENWGLTTTQENMPSNAQATIYRPGGPAITREVLSGDFAQANIWHNPTGTNGRTLEFSVLGKDRTYFDSNYQIPSNFEGGESYSFSERITVGQASQMV